MTDGAIIMELTPTNRDVEDNNRLLLGKWNRDEAENGATLSWSWDGYLSYTYDPTWTSEEARRAFVELAHRSRGGCVFKLLSIPDELVGVICPQIEEIIDFETAKYIARLGAPAPGIIERWGAAADR